MSFSILTILPWLFSSLLIGGLHVTSAAILLRERHTGPWLMLAGSAIALVGQTSAKVMQFFLDRRSDLDFKLIFASTALATLGALMFAIGLLLYALHQRGKANRIAELEAILNSRDLP